MKIRTPLTVITGPLGSGKTTLLRHILEKFPKKIAILMNEFGEIAIDAKIIQGKNVQMADLGGGCVCCSLLGEFEAAVNEIIDTVDPDRIVVETTGVAEPDALVFDIQESLTKVRLDGVITVIDADAMVKYPSLGHTTRLQIEAADIILLNKTDLVSKSELLAIEKKLLAINEIASIVYAVRGQVDPELLFGIGRERVQAPPQHIHQPEFESFSYKSPATFNRQCFEEFVNSLQTDIYRAKGFVRFPEGIYLFNFVSGRWDLEPFVQEATELVFIGKNLSEIKVEIINKLKLCEQ
ncbi:CobW family GTP-binding protein [Chlorogloeopsis fritschii PCC 9212]|uniref:G3E family GTPase n=1 Tax=Chlorogloeopsis fritschii PCC 6912 TaxID=211165 RepID=A0A3S0XN95_CHLFR|nr:GTP-binding protein [Chlorogloeopsis fritschii]MBF2005963.1 GTP-binding protein [Chlorogloeopsis fritschii C42_A2020_084]RUR73262.1 G3E family GTPase [Chlorogloeopsis fritschii PCC 6912]